MVRKTGWDRNSDCDRDRDQRSGRDRDLGSGLELGSGSGQVFVLSCFSEIYVAFFMDFLDAFEIFFQIGADWNGSDRIGPGRVRSVGIGSGLVRSGRIGFRVGSDRIGSDWRSKIGDWRPDWIVFGWVRLDPDSDRDWSQYPGQVISG